MCNPYLTKGNKMSKSLEEIQIYVACLAAYNNGYLHGRWIDANQDANEIMEDIQEMLKASPIQEAEEWAIHDYEGFEGVTLSEYENIQSVAQIASFISEHGELGVQILAYFGNIEDAKDCIEHHYAGEHKSLADFAQDITEETTEIPQNLQYYIDWEAMARDLEINDVIAFETGFECVHVFWRH